MSAVDYISLLSLNPVDTAPPTSEALNRKHYGLNIEVFAWCMGKPCVPIFGILALTVPYLDMAQIMILAQFTEIIRFAVFIHSQCCSQLLNHSYDIVKICLKSRGRHSYND